MKWPPWLLGALIGLLVTRHLLGALIGALLAGPLLRTWRTWRKRPPVARSGHSALGAVFTLLGQLAKADGRVCEREIAFCERLMHRLGLDNRGRQEAIAAFNAGKRSGFHAMSLDIGLRHRHAQSLLFLDLFIELALADGELHDRETHVLRRICRMLGLREGVLQQLLQKRRQRRPARPAAPAAPDPYAVLGVERHADTAQVRRAFRRLMSRHHPDKLAAAGASPEAIALAQERTTQLLAAWEHIKKARGVS